MAEIIQNNIDNKKQQDTTLISLKKLKSSISFLEKKLEEIKKENKLYNNHYYENLLISQRSRLKRLKIKYEILKQSGITNNTQKKLNKIFSEINIKVFNQEKIGNILNQGFSIIKNEKKDRKDNINILGLNISYRDFIEKYIDFQDIKESFGEKGGIKEFYNYFTIEYINFLNNNIAIKATHKNLKKLKGLNIKKEDFDKILKKVLKQLILDGKDLKFNKIIVKLNSKKINIDLAKIKIKIKENIKIKNTQNIINIINKVDDLQEIKFIQKLFSGSKIQNNNFDNIKEIENILNKSNSIGIILNKKLLLTSAIKKEGELEKYKREKLKKLKYIFSRSKRAREKEDGNNYIQNLKKSRKIAINLTKELLDKHFITKKELKEFNYILYLEVFELDEEIKNIVLSLIDISLEKDFIIRRKKQDGGNLKLDNNFIKKHKTEIFNNLKFFISVFLEIESISGNPKDENLKGSGAMGLYQFKINNGSKSIEYKKNNKWISNKDITEEEKKVLESREIRLTSSYETVLNYLVGFIKRLREKNQKFNNKYKHTITALENLFKKATGYKEVKIIRNKLKNKSPTDLSTTEQTILFLINSFKNGKNSKLNQHIGLVLSGNIWGVKKLYEIYHNTLPDKATIKLIQKSINLHKSKASYIK